MSLERINMPPFYRTVYTSIKKNEKKRQGKYLFLLVRLFNSNYIICKVNTLIHYLTDWMNSNAVLLDRFCDDCWNHIIIDDKILQNFLNYLQTTVHISVVTIGGLLLYTLLPNRLWKAFHLWQSSVVNFNMKFFLILLYLNLKY